MRFLRLHLLLYGAHHPQPPAAPQRGCRHNRDFVSRVSRWRVPHPRSEWSTEWCPLSRAGAHTHVLHMCRRPAAHVPTLVCARASRQLATPTTSAASPRRRPHGLAGRPRATRAVRPPLRRESRHRSYAPIHAPLLAVVLLLCEERRGGVQPERFERLATHLCGEDLQYTRRCNSLGGAVPNAPGSDHHAWLW